MAPPTMPALASKLDSLSPRLMDMFLWPVLAIESRATERRFLEIQSTLPMTLPMFMWILSSLKLTATMTRVSHEWAVVWPIQIFFWLSLAEMLALLPAKPPGGAVPGGMEDFRPRPGFCPANRGSPTGVVGASLSVWKEVVFNSPRKSLRTRVRRYQALGKARISDNRLMSYLKDAEPMSMIVLNRTTAMLPRSLPPALSRANRWLDSSEIFSKLSFRDREI